MIFALLTALSSIEAKAAPSDVEATLPPYAQPASPSPAPSLYSTPEPVSGSASPSFVPAFSGAQPPSLAAATPVPSWTLLPIAVRPGEGGDAWDAARVAALRADLTAIASGGALRTAHVGAYAVDTRDGHVLFEYHSDDPIQPASTFKLLVGSIALERLGPNFRFHTAAYLVPYPNGPLPQIEGGVTVAKLVLRGGGDPFLSSADLDDFALTVARAGLRTGLGGFAIDASHFDRLGYAPGWTWDDFLEDYAPKITATTLDENLVHVYVESGGREGAPAIVHVRPLALGPSEGCTQTFEPVITGTPLTLAAGAGTTLDVARDPRGCLMLVGGLAVDSPGHSFDIAVPDPEAYAYRVAVDRLHVRGVEVRAPEVPPGAAFDGTTVTDASTAPGARVLWSHDSPALAAILPRFWIPSDNLVGETLLEELGIDAGGEAAAHETNAERRGIFVPGESPARERAIAFERLWLRGIGVDTSPISISDGCGLSQYDRITAHALVAILQHDWNGRFRETVLDALPVGGARGHIPGVDGTGAAGRVWAKTGSINHVRGLAGYIATQHRGTVTFAFEVDDFAGDYGALNAARAAFLARIARE